jgi:hypothetical protein
MFEERAAVRGVNWNLSHPRHCGSEPTKDVLRAVGEHDCNAITNFMTASQQTRGDGHGDSMNLGERVLLALVRNIEENRLAVTLRTHRQDEWERPLIAIAQSRDVLVIGDAHFLCPLRGNRARRFSMKALAPSTMSGEPIAWTSMPRPET